MKTLLKISIAALFGFTILTASAAPLDPLHYPTELVFSDKPIDPLCFASLESQADVIDLNKCGLATDKYTMTDKNEALVKQGFYGFNWKDTTVNYPSAGSSYYQAWDAGNHQYWLYTANNGGGSGDFTTIDLYSRKDADTAISKTIVGGDRCNGGVGDAKEKDHHLQYSVNVTAYDFLGLAKNNSHQLKAYDDLASCAVCCAAKAIYEVDAKLKPKLLYVDLGKNAKVNEMPEQGKYQACFNKIFAAYVSDGKNKLDEVQLTQFVKQFNEACIK